MNLELFIARKIYFNGDRKKRFSSPAVKIAVAGIAIGLAAMILSVCIVIGFKKEIRDKVIGFGSHIQISNYDGNQSYETHPIRMDDTLRHILDKNPEIQQYEVFATKPGVIKTDNDFQGIILKGVSDDYDWSFIKKSIVEGSVLQPSDTSTINQVLISKYVANQLGLKLGDSFLTYFIQDPIKARKLTISGIYETNMEDYDKMFVITSLDLVQRVVGWDKDQVSGIEVRIKDFNRLAEVSNDLFFEMSVNTDADGNRFLVRSIVDMNSVMFGWLDLLDMNVWIIIILMVAVSGFTMISGLLIIILERTNMIGILKSLGATNYSIRKIFLYVSSFLIIKGMIWGNIIALGICLAQKLFGIIKLNPSTYFVSQMPVYINPFYICLINLGVLFISLLIMIGPSYLISKISPAKSIRFE